MHPPDIFRPTILRIAALLEAHGIRFHLTGGIASVAYGEPRMTQDVDIVVDNTAIARCLDSFIAAAGHSRSAFGGGAGLSCHCE